MVFVKRIAFSTTIVSTIPVLGGFGLARILCREGTKYILKHPKNLDIVQLETNTTNHRQNDRPVNSPPVEGDNDFPRAWPISSSRLNPVRDTINFDTNSSLALTKDFGEYLPIRPYKFGKHEYSKVRNHPLLRDRDTAHNN